MNIQQGYAPRPVRFNGNFVFGAWRIKLYTISIRNENVEESRINEVKVHLGEWLEKSKAYPLDTYQIATLIIHEGTEGCFLVLNWWIGENMLQNFCYLKRHGEPDFQLYSDQGMMTCIWEMAVLWHERNAWVRHILQQPDNPDVDGYLSDGLTADV